MSVAVPASTQFPTGIWRVDPIHSSVGFSVRYMGVSTFRSHFDAFDAELTVADDGCARLAGRVKPESVAVKDVQFAAHLAAQDFFDAARYPELRFESTLLRRDGATVELDGLLTMKGRTLPITAIGSVADRHEGPSGDAHMGVELRTRIDRRQFGFDWNMMLPKGGLALGTEVTLDVSLAFTRI